MEAPESEEILESLINASGLASVIAKGVILRCCNKASLSPKQLTHKDIAILILHIEPILKMYIPPSELQERVEMLRALRFQPAKSKT
jgi:hypothetical protein